jgi:hypothetical protein
MLEIITSTNVPDGTYFRVASAEPDLKESMLTVYDGQGSRRSSWGAPGVTSTVLLNADDLTAVHIGFHHKHGGGQFYRYYRFDGMAWQVITWAKLSDEDRVRVLDACERRAPHWAKVPGKLRQNYISPTMQTRTTYKLVELVDSTRLFSVYDSKTEYVVGKRLAERAVEEHGGGYYSYPTIDGVEQRFNDGTLFPERCYQDPMTLVLIECEISGTILEYQNGKLASTYLKPTRIVKQFDYNHELKEAC